MTCQEKTARQPRFLPQIQALLGIGRASWQGDGGTYNGEAHDESPETSPWVRLDSLPHAHLVLAVLAVEGLVHQVRVHQDIRVLDVLLLEVLLVVDMFALAQRLLGRLDVALSRHVYDVRTVCRRQRGEWGKKERQGQEDWAMARTRRKMGVRTLTLTRTWRLDQNAPRLHCRSATHCPRWPCFARSSRDPYKPGIVFPTVSCNLCG